MLLHQSDERIQGRPQAPQSSVIETLQSDDEIITQQNHPMRNPSYNAKFYPSFVGKTWGEMKQREANRNTDFFKSDDLDENLKTIYSFLFGMYSPAHKSYDSCILDWQSTIHRTLDLSIVNDLQNTASLPSSVRSVYIRNQYVPFSFAKNERLVVMRIEVAAKLLPVMPHVQILKWICHDKEDDVGYDFSGWTSLKILIITDCHCKKCKKCLKIKKLPPNLISFSYVSYSYLIHPKNDKFEDMFTDNNNISIFQSLKHVYLFGVQWPTLPVLTNCISLRIDGCKKLKTIEVPICRTLVISQCHSFMNLGSHTTKNNKDLDIVYIGNYDEICTVTSFQFPPGSPSGYKHIDLLNFPLSSLPPKFAPFAFISIFNSGYHIYIKDPQVRENLTFYFDHMRIQYLKKKAKTENIPRDDETICSMVDRKYGFNWPKFITKIQRQYRFNRFMKNERQYLAKFLPDAVCTYNIGKLFGAIQTFKMKNKEQKK